MKYGLLDPQFDEVIKILSSHPEIEEAVLFGSRAIDTFKEASDVDIALKGNKITSKFALDLEFDFEETDLPYFFDFVSYSHIDNKNLVEHIDKKGVVIYRKGWRTVKLKDILVIHYGKSLPKQNRVFGSVPVYSSAGLTGYHNETLVKNRGVIIGRKGTIGSVYKSDKPFFPIDTVFYISEEKLNDNLDFLFYTLSNLGLNRLNSDSAVPGLNRSIFYEQQINIPLSVKEQGIIAEVLSSLDDKIELLHEQNKTLEDMAQALFHKWFIKDANPSWPKGKLEDFLEKIESGSRPKGGIDSNLKEGIPSIGAESINGIGNFDFSKTKYITDDFFQTMKKGIVKDYDILIYKDGAYIGKKAMFGNGFPFKEMAVNEHIFILRSNNTTNQFFVYFLLKTRELSKLNTNSAQPGLNQQAVKSFRITTPPQSMMGKFGQIVKPWVDKIFFNSNQIKELEKLRDTLLPKLITGQIRVNALL